MIVTEYPPTTAPQLLTAISAQYGSLSRQLKLIGRYVETHREHLGIEGIQEVAAACNVQPSAVVRFAKHFGFSGYSEMQRLFRTAISQQIAPGRNYQARIRDVIEVGAPMTSIQIAQDFLKGSIAGMQQLQESLERTDLDRAVQLLADADAVWLVGMRRSYPVAAYLEYSLQHTDKRVTLVGGLGSMQEGQLRALRTGEVMLAISFAPYAQETLSVVNAAHAAGARVIAISDSRLSPLAELSEVVLTVQENAPFGFRSLTSVFGLAQSLFIALSYRLELLPKP
ncbi:MurR/RpiR family transcriptional regulator [Hydrogenophaga palleronii]|uniref:MurR/RpiR family transcriptional regulator n=1 Tax=Hydrogenophaga palleronii TaxID=65655 RepID=UPI0008269FAD|nr:MurR/RpiR family transcriptional regulator [Hydrogenophaga palleronii]